MTWALHRAVHDEAAAFLQNKATQDRESMTKARAGHKDKPGYHVDRTTHRCGGDLRDHLRGYHTWLPKVLGLSVPARKR